MLIQRVLKLCLNAFCFVCRKIIRGRSSDGSWFRMADVQRWWSYSYSLPDRLQRWKSVLSCSCRLRGPFRCGAPSCWSSCWYAAHRGLPEKSGCWYRSRSTAPQPCAEPQECPAPRNGAASANIRSLQTLELWAWLTDLALSLNRTSESIHSKSLFENGTKVFKHLNFGRDSQSSHSVWIEHLDP